MARETRPGTREWTDAALTALDPARWVVLPDMRWPGPDEPAADHVVVGPTGVFVVESRAWTGLITVRNDMLRSDERSRDHYVKATVETAESLADLLPEDYRALVRPVICLTRQGALTGTTRGALLCAPSNLADTLSRGPVLLGRSHVEYVESVIRAGMRLATDGTVVHVAARPRRPQALVPRQRPRPGGPTPVPPRPEAVTGTGQQRRIARAVFAGLVLCALLVAAAVTDPTALLVEQLP